MAKKLIQVVYTVNDAALIKASASIKANEKAANDADKAVNKFGKDAKKAGDDAGKSFLNLGNIWKGLIAIGIVSFVTSLAKKTFDLGVQQEQLNIAFSTFLGSAEKAKKLLGDLTKFAIVTPFTPDQVNSAAKALLAFGVQGEEIIPTLKMLGDVSAGTGKDLTEMAIIFGQIRSTGRLMGQDLLQLINAGFNPLQVISQKTGKSVADLKKEMEKGLITFDMVSDAFKTATSEGGLFFNLMEKQSQSVGGLLSTVSGNLDEILKNIFTATSGPIKEFTQQLVELSEALLSASKSAEQWADEAALAENKSILDGFKAFATAFSDIQKAQFANVQSLNQELLRLSERQKELETSTKTLTDADIKEYDAIANRISQIKREAKVVDEYVLSVLKKTEVEKDNTINIIKLKEQSKLLSDQIDKAAITDIAEIARLQKKKQEIDALIALIGTLNELQSGSDIIEPPVDVEFNIDNLINANGFLTDDQRKALEEDSKRTREKIDEATQASLDRQVAAEIAATQHKDQIRRASFDLALGFLSQLANALIDEGTNEVELTQDKYDQIEKDNEESEDKQLEAAGDNERARLEIKKNSEKKRKELDDQKERDLDAARIRQAQKEKETNIKRMTIENILNSIKALGTPPVPNFALAGVTLGFGLAGIATAAVLGFKDGVIGLQGPGTGKSDSIPARLSRGESVITAEATSRSRNLLEAIQERRIDDRVLEKAGVKPSTKTSDRAPVIKVEQPDLVKQGAFIYEVKQVRENFKMRIRSKSID